MSQCGGPYIDLFIASASKGAPAKRREQTRKRAEDGAGNEAPAESRDNKLTTQTKGSHDDGHGYWKAPGTDGSGKLRARIADTRSAGKEKRSNDARNKAAEQQEPSTAQELRRRGENSSGLDAELTGNEAQVR